MASFIHGVSSIPDRRRVYGVLTGNESRSLRLPCSPMDSPTPQPVRPDTDSIVERLQKQFGGQIDPTLPLEPEPSPDKDAPSSLFDRLRGAGSRGTRYKLLGE